MRTFNACNVAASTASKNAHGALPPMTTKSDDRRALVDIASIAQWGSTQPRQEDAQTVEWTADRSPGARNRGIPNGEDQVEVLALAQEKDMCCWHTSAMMIWMYWQGQSGRSGPMNTLKPVYEANTGISPQAFITLGKTVGLTPSPRTPYSTDDLFALLTNSGPLWSAGYWYGAPHVIVLTGIDGGQVSVNDPDGAQLKTGTLAWFNEKLASSLVGCVMAKDKSAY